MDPCWAAFIFRSGCGCCCRVSKQIWLRSLTGRTQEPAITHNAQLSPKSPTRQDLIRLWGISSTPMAWISSAWQRRGSVWKSRAHWSTLPAGCSYFDSLRTSGHRGGIATVYNSDFKHMQHVVWSTFWTLVQLDSRAAKLNGGGRQVGCRVPTKSYRTVGYQGTIKEVRWQQLPNLFKSLKASYVLWYNHAKETWMTQDYYDVLKVFQATLQIASFIKGFWRHPASKWL